jgi:CRP/FNR family transcriptional regulator, cyclic AMP receptor protein
MSSPYGLEFVESCLGCKLPCEEFFCFLPPTAVAAFDKIKFANFLPRGSTLYVAGQKASGVYVVCIGKIKVWTTGPSGRVLIVKIASPGEVLGLHACLAGTPHEFTAETVQPSQVAFVKGEEFLSLLQADRNACWKAANILGRQCHETYDFVRTMGQRRPASERLARFMLDVATPSEGAKIETCVQVGLTHEELAQAIGMSRETVWRILCQFRDQGLAVFRGSTLRIQDRASLERLAGR